MTNLLKVSLIALALVGTAAHADTGHFAGETEAHVEDGLDSSAYRPGRPVWRPGYPDRSRRVHRCVARDFRGRTYIARGFGNINRVAREALRSCRYNSRFPQTCRVIRCR